MEIVLDDVEHAVVAGGAAYETDEPFPIRVGPADLLA